MYHKAICGNCQLDIASTVLSGMTRKLSDMNLEELWQLFSICLEQHNVFEEGELL